MPILLRPVPLFLQDVSSASSVADVYLVDVNNELDQAHTKVFSRSFLVQSLWHLQDGCSGINTTFSSDEHDQKEKKQRTTEQPGVSANKLFHLKRLPNFFQMHCYSGAQTHRTLFQDGWREGSQWDGGGMRFPFEKARVWALLHLWCASGITPFHSVAELWINRQLHLSPQTCHLQWCQSGAEVEGALPVL